jgi:hypothetical protein
MLFLPELWDVALHPSENCSMSFFYPKLSHQICRITVGEFVCYVLLHTENNY